MKLYVMLFGLSLLLFSTHLYVYAKGLQDGIVNYKRSIHMTLALESAYNFGVQDGYSFGWINGYRTCNNLWKNKCVAK